eukprot:evm.model.scf_764.5 EVM.evm.TU.scf_764.5   scf_764:51418-51759(+)
MSLTLSNAFAALEVRKAKKKKARESEKKKKSARGEARREDSLRLEQEIFSRPQLNVSNWADCDDEEDDFDAAAEDVGGARAGGDGLGSWLMGRRRLASEEWLQKSMCPVPAAL